MARSAEIRLRRLRVLLPADGRSFHTVRYIAELRRQGCRVLPVSLERGGVVHHQMAARGPAAFHYAMASCELKSIIKRWKPDVVNPHFASGYGFMTALAGAREFAPVVLHMWGSDVLLVPQKSTLHRRKTRYALGCADAVIGDSEFLCDRAATLAVLRERHVIPWGIEQQYLDLYRNRRRADVPLTIIVPRTHERVYNNDFLLDALRPFLVDGLVRVTFPESGSRYERFCSRCVDLPEDSVRFYSRCSRDDFLALMASHDVYLSAARSDSSPASLIEAMAVGLFPIAANIAGVREWLNDKTGLTFAENDADGLRQTISKVLDATVDISGVTERNAAMVRERAVFENNIARTIEIMRSLCSRRG